MLGTCSSTTQTEPMNLRSKIGVERVFPVYSPLVDSVAVVRKGKVRRAKLYYLRGRRGKSARIVERQDRTAGAGEEKTAE